jgi:hypothetical protein
MIKIENKQIYSDAGKYVHRLGTEQYFRRSFTLSGDTVEKFEEVDSIPEIEDSIIPIQEQMLKAQRLTVKTMTTIENPVALEIPDLFPNFVDMIGEAVKKGNILKYMGKLYRVRQDHTVLAVYTPGIETASLYEVIDREHDGTLSDPIPYTPPMEIFEGKYYIQSSVLYRCTRDSGTALTHNLSELVRLYVEVVEES